MQDVTNNPYLHLVDGGISDNLDLRAIIDRVDALGGFVKNYELSARPPKNVLLILVNAAVTPKKSFSLSPGKPSISETIEALSSTQITLFNADTIDHVKDKIEEFKSELVKNNHSVNFYFAELNFKSFSLPSAKDFFNNLPTSLELDKDQVDLIILTGRKLLRNNKQYQYFLKANNGEFSVDDKNLSCNRLLAWAFIEAANVCVRRCEPVKRFYEKKQLLAIILSPEKHSHTNYPVRVIG
jgi:NTE family protein